MSYDSHSGLCDTPPPPPPRPPAMAHYIFSNLAITYIKAWMIKSNCMGKSALPTHTHMHVLVPQLFREHAF